jgi:hypothetical protein
VIIGSGPNWLGSPQHFVGGVGLAAAVVLAARWRGLGTSLAFALAVGIASTVEILIELVEYPLLYADKFHASAYYDTLADMGNTLVGGLVGGGVAAYLIRHRAD